MAARRKLSALTFRAAPVRVRVPATSANLGPGFDAFGLALDWFDDLVAQVQDEPGIDVDVMGEGADEVPRDESHLVAKSMLAAFDAMGGRPEGFSLVTANHIPHGRGMGSSSAAIVGGIALARALVVGGDQLLTNESALQLANEIEGHPDNVAAALLGGFTIAWHEKAEVKAVRLVSHPTLSPVICIPAEAVETRVARGLLPEKISHADATFNAGRAALLTAAMTDHPELLFAATEEKLHQAQRKSAMPDSHALMLKLRKHGHAAVISGAGPTVLVLATEHVVAQVAELAGAAFAVQQVGISKLGAHVVPLDA